jgi:predicted MFS family arabinose efflux permease
MGFLVNFVRVVFAPLLQPVAAEFQVATASLGVVTTAVWLGSAAPRLPTGILLTRVDRHRVLAGTGAILVVTAIFTAYSSSVEELVVGAFLLGLSSGMYFIAANPLVSELFPDRVLRAIAIHGVARQVAAVIAPLVVAVILFVADWRSTFFGVALAAAGTTLFLLYAARWTDLPSAGAGDRSLLAAGRSEWPIILTGIVFIGAMGFLWNGLFNLYGGYLATAKGIAAANGRLLLSLMFAAGIPAFLLSSWVGNRYPTVPLIIGLTGAFAVSVLALTAVGTVATVAILSLLIGFSFFLMVPLLDTYLLSTLPDHHRGSAYAIYSAVMMVIQATGSGVVGSAVAAGASYDATFQSIALVVVMVAVGMYLLHAADRLPSEGTA